MAPQAEGQHRQRPEVSSRSDGEEWPEEEEPEKQVTRALSGCLGFSLTVGEPMLWLRFVLLRNPSCSCWARSHAGSCSRAGHTQVNQAKIPSRLTF